MRPQQLKTESDSQIPEGDEVNEESEKRQYITCINRTTGERAS